MPSTAEEVSTFLAAQMSLTEATDLFIGTMPENPNKVLVIIPTGGRRPEMEMGARGIRFENASLQIWSRGAPEDYDDSMDQAQAAWGFLAGIQAPDTLSGTEYLTVIPAQSPFLIDRDDNKRVITGFNVDIRKVPS